jgi:hypothetical protein
MEKKITDLTVSELKNLVSKIVRKELAEYDPDDNLVINNNVKDILKKSTKERKSGKQKLYSFSETFGQK